MASAYECTTLTEQQRSLLVRAVEQAIANAPEVPAADMVGLFCMLCNAHRIVLKNKHMRAA